MDKAAGIKANRLLKRALAAVMSLFILAGGVAFPAQAQILPEEPGTESRREEKNENTCSEISSLIADTWENDYFGTIYIDGKTGGVTVDGEEKLSVPEKVSQPDGQKEPDIAGGNPQELTKNEVEDYAESILPEDGIYNIEEKEQGNFEITAPFQTKRLIVEALVDRELCDTDNIIYNTELNETILQFETEEETKKAYLSLKQRYGGEHCYPDEIYYMEDMLEAVSLQETGVYSWGNRYMGMDELKAKAAGSAPVTVAVLDTGIDKSNFMFHSRIISPRSYNFIDNNNNIKDNHGHGTHVSGIIADATPANVEIMMMKISNTSGYSSLLTIKTALQYALNQDIDVINMSLGFVSANAGECTYLDSLINKAYNRGIAVCTAAGNNSVDVGYCYPACNKKTLAVSAMDADEKLAYYSNRGSLIDFSAPGSQVLSASTNGGLIGMSGTSMSSPHVAAAISYIKMLQPDISVPGIYSELKARCKDLGIPGKDSLFGWGCPVLTGLFDSGLIYKISTVTEDQNVPQLKSVQNVEEGIKLTWSKAGNAKRYYIFRKAGNGRLKKIKTVKGKTKSWVDKNTSHGKMYTYVIKAVKGKKTSGQSNPMQIVRLKKVENLQVKSKKSKSAEIRWKKRAGVSGYEIMFASNKKMKNARLLTVSKKVRLVRLADLTRKKIYYFKIRAVKIKQDEIFYSAWSGPKKIKIK